MVSSGAWGKKIHDTVPLTTLYAFFEEIFIAIFDVAKIRQIERKKDNCV
jgi:hypothetical protein